MKIEIITSESIIFDNGNEITYSYSEMCCTTNYADFEQIEELAFDYNFSEDLRFEVVEESGFRFGDNYMMFFIPCYSEQNGYYSSDIQIYYNGNKVLSFDAQLVY